MSFDRHECRHPYEAFAKIKTLAMHEMVGFMTYQVGSLSGSVECQVVQLNIKKNHKSIVVVDLGFPAWID